MQPDKTRLSLPLLCSIVLALCASLAMPARAHNTTYAVYSKYEATTADRTVAFVFAFDKRAVLSLLERDVTHRTTEPGEIAAQLPYFSKFLFSRFSVRNDGALCTHPDKLARLFWDDKTKRVIAATAFNCPAGLHELTIHSTVTHDMPVAHELVGDLKHGSSLVRSFFYDDNVDDTIALARIRKSSDGSASSASKRRGKFSFVAMPDRTRRYDAITQGLLDGADGGGAAVDEHPLRTVTHFIGQGILHIFTGYDHVLFIVTLLLGVATWRQLALIVTAFTAAHSLTLALATLDIVSLPSQIVEPVIAASVLFVAVDAFVRPHARARVLVTFCFGLVHGFGLSSVLRDLGLSGGQLFPALLGFNLGVECGQLAIVAPLFPLILWLRKKPPVYVRTRNVLCASVALLAMCWIVIRVKEALVG